MNKIKAFFASHTITTKSVTGAIAIPLDSNFATNDSHPVREVACAPAQKEFYRSFACRSQRE